MSPDKAWIDPIALREEVKKKYREVASNPTGAFHFHTGRGAARRFGYSPEQFEHMPEAAVESFAGWQTRFRCGRCEWAKRYWTPVRVLDSIASSQRNKWDPLARSSA
jgi:hypothetical protein